MRLPNNWSLKRFEDIAEIVTGTTPSTKSPEYYDGEIPFVTPADLDSGKPLTSSLNTLTELGAMQARLLPKRTVLVSCIGTIGKTGIAGTQLTTNQQINSLICNQQIAHPEYVYHYACTLKHALRHMSSSTTLPIVNKSRFKQVQIPLPPLAEQQRIAAILDKADALRTKRRAALAKLDTLLQATFLHMFGDPVTNSMGWEVRQLGELLNFITSGSRGWAQYYADKGTRFIRSLDVRMNFISNEDKVYVNAPDTVEAKRTLTRPNDVLLTITGSQIGRVSTVPYSFEEANISQHVAILRLDESRIQPKFVSMFLSLDTGGQRQIEKCAYGQTKPGLNFEQIRSFQIPCPPMQKQQQFLKFWERFEIQINNIKKSDNHLDTLFHSLQQRAFKGEL